MINFIKTFRDDEDGAVTVDWVVLTAAVVGLAIAAYSSIETSATGLIDAAARSWWQRQTDVGRLRVNNTGTGRIVQW